MWTVPATRMKTRIAHRVPLSSAALSVLREALDDAGLRDAPSRDGHADLVFPGVHGRLLSRGVLWKVAIVHRQGSLAPVVADRAVDDIANPTAVEVHVDAEFRRVARGANRDPGCGADAAPGAEGHPAAAREKHARRVLARSARHRRVHRDALFTVTVLVDLGGELHAAVLKMTHAIYPAFYTLTTYKIRMNYHYLSIHPHLFDAILFQTHSDPAGAAVESRCRVAH